MTITRFGVIFSIISLIVSGLTYYLLKKRLHLSPRGNKLLLSVLVISAILMVVGPIQYRVYHASVESVGTWMLQFSQYYLMGWIGVTLIIFGIAEILQFLSKAFDPSKRIFLTEGVAKGLLATTSLATFGGWIQLKMGPKIERVTITLPTLPKSFDGFTIAQVSDMHVGPIQKKEFVQDVVQKTMELKPDLIALTGDFVDGSVYQLKNQMTPLQQLSAPHGIYFCTGNHEYYSGVEEWISQFEAMGIQVFKNSNKIIEKKNSDGTTEKFLLAGVFDLQGERFSELHRSDPHKASQTAEAVTCKILLAHNPRSIEDACSAGFHLQLSGHTHAGQFYPFSWIARLVHRYFEGHYQVTDTTQLYVNRGTGFWGPPNRLGKTSEITFITLKSPT